MVVLQVRIAFPLFILISVNLLLGTYTFFYAVKVSVGCNDSNISESPDEILTPTNPEDVDEMDNEELIPTSEPTTDPITTTTTTTTTTTPKPTTTTLRTTTTTTSPPEIDDD